MCVCVCVCLRLYIYINVCIYTKALCLLILLKKMYLGGGGLVTVVPVERVGDSNYTNNYQN